VKVREIGKREKFRTYRVHKHLEILDSGIFNDQTEIIFKEIEVERIHVKKYTDPG